jgi:DNA-directed RNA polymerase specialized sigma24 family protein
MERHMSRDAEYLMDQLLVDGELREAFKQDPVATAESLDVQLTDDQRAAVDAVDWEGVSDEELTSRMNRAFL